MTKALVILSGGQDSTTVAAQAIKECSEVHALSFNYGQRHKIELESARSVAQSLGLASHEVLELGETILLSSSPLTSNNELGQYDSADELPDGVEPTFVAGRNILFLTLAANRAAALGIRHLYCGLCEEDFAGYWDCRRVFVDKMQAALGEGIFGDETAFTVHTPLMHLNKAESVLLALDLLGDNFERVMEQTHTCYAGVKGGCGKCHACHLRDRGFRDAGVNDPIWKLRGVAV